MLELHAEARVATQATVLPQLVARAALLELSQDELEEMVRERLEANPALELVHPGGLPCPAAEGSEDFLARFPAPVTLRDDLHRQLTATSAGPQRRIAEYLVECLDERGYLTTPLHEVAHDLGVEEDDVRGALALVQELEPRGIGARDLAECLRLQALALAPGEAPPGLLEFLDGEFCRIVENGDPRSLQATRAPGAAMYLGFISRCLYPYPADVYRPPWEAGGGATAGGEPDATIRQEGRRLRVSIPLSRRLALRLNAAYESLARSIEGRVRCGQVRDARALVAEAQEFMANLAQRHLAIARVAAAVVREQEQFVLHGPACLKPLTKKALARKLGLHESTVCRATRGKTVMLPDGRVVSFDVFFEDALPVKAALAQVIRREDPGRPLRDGELVDKLRQRGYVVARRTVSKYRACMGIPPAAERRACV